MGRKFHPSLLSQTRLLGYRDLDPSAANGDEDSVTTFLAYYSYHYYFLINQLHYTTDSYVKTLAVAYTYRLTNFFSPKNKKTDPNQQAEPTSQGNFTPLLVHEDMFRDQQCEP